MYEAKSMRVEIDVVHAVAAVDDIVAGAAQQRVVARIAEEASLPAPPTSRLASALPLIVSAPPPPTAFSMSQVYAMPTLYVMLLHDE